MAILTTDFNALTDDMQEIFNEVAKTSMDTLEGFKIFNIKDTDRKTYEYLVIHGLEGIKKIAEGADLPTVSTVQGDTITATQSRYGAIVSVTKDMRLFDLYDQIESVVRSITEDAFQKVDQSLADVLLNGFSASNYADVYGESVSAVGPNGLALFSATQTTPVSSNTFRNLIRRDSTDNPILSREAIVKARVDAMTYKDPAGVNRPINLDTLLVAPEKEDEALRIINSSLISGSAENDINPLRGKVSVKSWSKLQTRTGGTDTSGYWFLYDSSRVKNSLQALFRERPSLDAPEQVYKNKNWDYSVDFYYAILRGFQAYIWGSTGTA